MKVFTKSQYLLVLLCCCVIYGYGQVTIASQSFEETGDTWAFTTSPAPYNTEDALGDNGTVNGDEDVWDDIAGFVDDIDAASDGTLFWGMQDLQNNNGGGNFDHTLTFTQNITSHEDVTISFDYNVIGFDNGDDLFYELVYDGISQGEVFVVEGANGGGVSTSGWETETLNIPNTVTVVGITLKATQNGGTDYAGWDNVVISGTAILPVEIVFFSGVSQNNQTLLKFSTATEQNNSHFLIQHSIDEGKTFQTIGQLDGKGDSNSPVDYEFIDTKPIKGLNYYRLQQVDYDGTVHEEGIITVRFDGVEQGPLTVFPNPVINFTTMSWSQRAEALELIDTQGRLLLTISLDIKGENGTHLLDMSTFPAGLYFIRLVGEDRNELQKIIKR